LPDVSWCELELELVSELIVLSCSIFVHTRAIQIQRRRSEAACHEFNSRSRNLNSRFPILDLRSSALTLALTYSSCSCSRSFHRAAYSTIHNARKGMQCVCHTYLRG
jgi:hypothetical protein